MGPLQMDFTFKNIRQFQAVIIHINNHYSRDIQIFSRAKIYFSNEEGKFGDDRAVDYLYMPDAMVEDARNVTINLHEEHGKYVMMQLFFAAKWILISEITFVSGNHKRYKRYSIPPPYPCCRRVRGETIHNGVHFQPNTAQHQHTCNTNKHSCAD